MTAKGTALYAPLTRTAAQPAPSPLLLRVDVHRDVNAAVLEAWADLETRAPCSVYQTRAWLLPWIETIGLFEGIEPLFLIARGRDDATLALLCLGVRRVGPIRIATFLGGKDSNFNIPLVQANLNWGDREWRRLLFSAAHLMGDEAPDAFLFLNQPIDWVGHDAPFLVFRHQRSPSAAFGTRLPPRAEDLFAARLSKDTRKKLRKKVARLGLIGAVAYRIAKTADERKAILDAFFAQKTDRFRNQDIVSTFDTPAMRDFVDAASAGGSFGTAIELHALFVGERIVAVYGGAAHGGQWSGMFNSFDPDPEIARTSPGDLLLMAIMTEKCAAGLARFDLGIGEARYKSTFCGDAIPLFDSFLPVSFKGRIVVEIASTSLRMKRTIKQRAPVYHFFKKVRALKLWVQTTLAKTNSSGR